MGKRRIQQSLEHWTIIMKNFTPRCIQEVEADRRRIKEGWYATNTIGQVCSGPFPNREDCQAYIKQDRIGLETRIT
jgi:hypothetical protein